MPHPRFAARTPGEPQYSSVFDRSRSSNSAVTFTLVDLNIGHWWEGFSLEVGGRRSQERVVAGILKQCTVEDILQ